MNTVKVKICGIRSLEVAQAAVNAGADFLGFNFVPTSPRFIDPIVARAIAKAIRGKVALVGVFSNADVTEIAYITNLIGLDFVQLHGDENDTYMNMLNTKIIKKTTLDDGLITHKNIAYLLLDRAVQGQGEVVNAGAARTLSQKLPIFLAGGLTVENVASMVQLVQPFAVDVASGIETDGKEDREKIVRFIYAAKGVRE